MGDLVDVVVIGAGPNGLAAAAAVARAGVSVRVIEASPTIGGGTRSEELAAPGFLADVCSAIHATTVISPFMRALPLAEHGLEWTHPPVCLAHPLDDGTAATLERSIDATAESLGDPEDARAYARMMFPFVGRSDALFHEILGPLRFPRIPLVLMRFGLLAMRSATGLARSAFRGPHARALFAGNAAHSFLPLEAAFSAAFGLVLPIAGHTHGWPCARGGSQSITRALAAYVKSLGGDIATDRRVTSMSDLPAAKAYIFDVAPRHLAAIAGERLPAGFRARLERYRHGPRIFKIDYALDGPIPWTAPRVAEAGTVHLGGTLEELSASESAIGRGEHPERPFVLVAQQSHFDPTRAPAGKHTGWVYCHVPAGSTVDMTGAIEAQIERFAPGFGDRVLARHVMTTADLETYNANYVGGDIVGGGQRLHAALLAPHAAGGPLLDPEPGHLHLLRVDASGGRRPRDVRLLRGEGRAAPRVRAQRGACAGARALRGSAEGARRLMVSQPERPADTTLATSPGASVWSERRLLRSGDRGPRPRRRRRASPCRSARHRRGTSTG
jgi:phytoene dehydrogenase-like protein